MNIDQCQQVNEKEVAKKLLPYRIALVTFTVLLGIAWIGLFALAFLFSLLPDNENIDIWGFLYFVGGFSFFLAVFLSVFQSTKWLNRFLKVVFAILACSGILAIFSGEQATAFGFISLTYSGLWYAFAIKTHQLKKCYTL